MGEFWKSLSWDLKVLIGAALILTGLIFFSFLSPDRSGSFASPLVFLTIGVISIVISLKPTLQDSSTTFAATITASFISVLVILMRIPINFEYWAEIFSLIGLLVAICISIIRNLIYVYQEKRYDVYGQRDIRRRMLKWASTDKFAHLPEKEANKIRSFLDQHNIK